MDNYRLRRSALFLPAANARAIVKARSLDCDAVILDLEDAVAPAAKPAARDAAVAAVRDGGWGHRAVLIRVNALVTPWSEDDFAAFAGLDGLDGLVVPKVGDAADAAVAVSRAGSVPIWAMIETPRAVLAADAIAVTPGVAALVAGTNDLGADLHARPHADRLPLLFSLSRIVLAARAAGIFAFDGVFNSLTDAMGLAREANHGRDLGFDGKSVIHPGQIAAVNAVFGPSAGEIAAAHGLIATFDTVLAKGSGVTAHGGAMVEALHVAAARRLLAQAAAVAARAA